MKRSYELTFVVRIDPSDEVMNEAIDQVKAWVEAGEKGVVKKIDRWGRRRLAYEIDNQREGYYVLFEADIDADHIEEIERDLKLSGQILRYLVIKQD
jgi:small subunit ribosomal protein S6